MFPRSVAFFPTFLASAALLLQAAASQELDDRHKLHTPAEILKIMENSDLVYELGIGVNLDSINSIKPIVLSNQLLLNKRHDGSPSVVAYSISDEAKTLASKGESLFVAGKPLEARDAYQTLRVLEPSYHHALTLLGDTYFAVQAYDSAMALFLQAIDSNYVSYTAHWFLADTYSKLGERDKALEEITVAHLLNVNHEAIKAALVRFREEAQRPWNDWQLVPEYSVQKHENMVIVKASEPWLGYAMVKALWRFEPGYAQSMLGDMTTMSLASNREEKEALLAYLTGQEDNKLLTQIVTDGFADELVLYELMGKRYPAGLLPIAREPLIRLVEYINRYH